MFVTVETAPSIGMSITVVAVLLVISVRNVTSNATHKMINTVLKLLTPESKPAAYSLKPDSEIAVPRQIPDPTKITRPQGI